MSVHWAHVTASYVLVLGGFLVLGLGAALRHRAAKRRLLVLDPRAKRGKAIPPDDRSAAWRGGLNRPEQTPSDDRSAAWRGGLNRPEQTP